MAMPEFLVPLWQWIETHALTSPELAGFGLVAAFGLLVFLCAIVGKSLVSFVSRLVSVISASAVSRDRAPGYRVLLATLDGPNGSKARRFLETAMETHLPTFSFDAPFRLVKTGLISGGRDEAAVKAARRRLKRSGADMIVWGRRISARPDGLRIYTLSRGGGMSVGEAQVEIATLPGRKIMWNETLAPVAAYLIARRLQPSLGRPSDFRPERMEPVVGALLDKQALETMALGDVIIFRLRPSMVAKHAAIVSAPQKMIHAIEGAPVSEVVLSSWWRRHIAGVFSFPGVE